MACAIPQRVSPRRKTQMRIYLWLAALPPMGLAVAAWFFLGPMAAIVPVAAAVVLIIAGIILPRMYYERTLYTRHREWMKIERGILWKQIMLLPRRQIQFIRVRRGLVERMLGLCTLVFVTSGGRTVLHGLTPEDASRMRELFAKRSG